MKIKMTSTMTTEELIEQLKKFLGEKLKSVIAYGATVRGDQDGREFDPNLAVIVSDLNLDTLGAVRSAVEKWIKQGNSIPFFFTPEQLAESLDVFPIEFLDMNRHHHMLLGPDPLAGLSIETSKLRHQLEYELRVKQIQLRRIYMETADDAKLHTLIPKGVSSLTALMRASLHLAGREVPSHRKEVWAAMNALAPVGSDGIDTFPKLLETFETMVRFIDKFTA